MPLGTLERSAPPFFKQGPSARTRLAMYGVLAVFLMVVDARWHLSGPVRQAIGIALYPVQWLMLQPVELARHGAGYFQSLQAAQQDTDAAHRKMAWMSQRANQADELALENDRLRKLLSISQRLAVPSQAAQVIYDTPDPFTRRVVIDQGRLAGVELGAPVLDEAGVLGQVTRIYPLVSEVTLLIDRDQAIPVLNIRTGVRGVAYGDPVVSNAGGMELRFMPANADVMKDDLLTTSGVDGLYPPGLPVARVVSIERRADSAFARIECAPLSQVRGARHVIVLKPVMGNGPPERPEPAPPGKKGTRR